MIRGLKMRRVGATGRSYSATVPQGSKITVAFSEHGYQLKAAVVLNYNAMTEAQAAKAHSLLYAALSEALAMAAIGRKINVPLFDYSELDSAPRGTIKGVNER